MKLPRPKKPGSATLAVTLMLVAFAGCAAQQIWHTHQIHRASAAIDTARGQQVAFANYLLGFEHQFEGLLFLVEGKPEVAQNHRRVGEQWCNAARAVLRQPQALPAGEFDALLAAEEELRQWFEYHAQNQDHAPSQATYWNRNRLTLSAQALADALELKNHWVSDRLSQRIEQRIRQREQDEIRQLALTLLITAFLAGTAVLYVGMLTRRLTSEKQFARRVIESSPNAILLKDRDGKLVDYNQVFADFHGIGSPEEGVGHTASDFELTQENAEFLAAQERYVIETQRSLLNLREPIGPPEKRRWINISRVPLRDHRGRVSGVLINFNDDTHRAESARKLEEMSGNLAMGLAAAHGGEWETNLLTDQAKYSPRWLEMVGLNPEQAPPHRKTWRELIHPDDRAQARTAIDEYLAGRTAEYRNEHRLRQPDGSYRWNLTCGRVVERDPGGAPVRMQGISLDIDEAKQTQQALSEAVDRAEAASEAKSTFLATVSHELRTPLTGVIGMTDLLRDTGLSDRQRSLVGACRLSSELLLGIINDVLDFSKIEANHLEIEHQPFSVARCVWSAATVMAVHAHRSKLELDVHTDPALPPVSVGDNGRLRQVIVNLLANAVKFTEAGRVRVEARPAEGPPGSVRIEVTDSGIGIPEDQLDRLFDPFVQTDASVTRRYGGTGLGLSICRSLVEAMGGTIDATSRLGRGSTFGFTVPLPAGTAGSAPSPRPAPTVPPARVLLIDPDPVSRPDLTQRLAAMGLAVQAHATWDHRADPAASAAPHDPPHDLVICHHPANADPAAPPRFGDQTPPRRLVLCTLTQTQEPASSPGSVCHLLAKPFCDLQLSKALYEVLKADLNTGPPTPAAPRAPQTPKPDGPELGDPAARPAAPDAPVLIVEDDATNRMYLGELLRRQDVAYVAVTDGVQAVEAYTQRLGTGLPGFRLVLMDYHLPRMDGWTATQQIRRAEIAAHRPPATVLGITAGGSQTDRDHGKNAGINGWLNKPLQPQALNRALAEHLDARPPSAAHDRPPLDVEATLARCLGDTAFLADTLDSFASHTPGQMDLFDNQLATGDPAAAGRTAHAIKGAAGLIAAATLGDLAARCESWGKADDGLDRLRDIATELRQETDRCVAYARELRHNLPT